MRSASSPPPMPWESLGYRNFDLARLFDATFRRRRRLAAWYPWVRVPHARVGSPYIRGTGYPAGALVRSPYWFCSMMRPSRGIP